MVQEAGPKSGRRIETPSSPYDPTSRSSTEPWDQKNSFPIKSSAPAFRLFARVTGAPESTWHGHAHSSSSQDQFLQYRGCSQCSPCSDGSRTLAESQGRGHLRNPTPHSHGAQEPQAERRSRGEIRSRFVLLSCCLFQKTTSTALPMKVALFLTQLEPTLGHVAGFCSLWSDGPLPPARATGVNP